MSKVAVLSRIGAFGLLWVSALACTANVTGPGATPGAATAGTGAGVGGGGGGGATGAGGATGSIDPKTGVPTTCDASKPLAAPAPILRLTNREYANTLADLFPGLTFDAATLAQDNKDDGFDTIASAQSISSALIEGYYNQAGNVATAAVAHFADWLPCAAAPTPDATCKTELLNGFVTRAYRRALTADELGRVGALFDTAQTSWGFARAVEVTIRATLQSPAFLYRVELGRAVADQPDTTPLTGNEVASRLSYLLWDSMPDTALLSAASTGALDEAAGVETQAQRLLADPRAHDAVATFQSQWLRFEKMSTLAKSPTLFPSFTDTTAAALRDSAARYVDYLFWQRGKLDAFFTDNKAFVNDELAPIYGVTPPGSKELSLTDVNPQQRAGILTQAGLLAGFAHETADAPVLRGVFVLSRLLCAEPPAPPPGIPAAPAAMAGDAPMTTRQRLEQTHVKPACVGCHNAIDSIGYGFSHYDAVGAWRDTDSGLPVDATGLLTNTLDVDGSFDGAVQLGQKLSQSVQVKACMAQQWYRYALGVPATDVDTCALKSSIERLTASSNDLQQLLIGLVSSEAFRRRAVITP